MASNEAAVPKVRAVRRTTLTNAACPKCDSPLCYSPKRWLYCPRCSRQTKLGTK